MLDSSAVLAWLSDEPGSRVVEDHLRRGGATIGAVNWSEVAQKVRASGASWPLARALLASHDVEVVAVGAEDAEAAAAAWRRGDGLSLADRLCLVLGDRSEAPVLTADTAWSGRPGVVMIR